MITRLGKQPEDRAPHLSWLLFGVTAMAYVFSYARTNFNYDGEMMYRVTESLALRHSIQIADPMWHVNEPYSFYGLAISLLFLPFFALSQLLFGNGRILINFYQPCISALTVVALSLLFVKLGCSWRRSVGLSLVYAFGTLAWHYTGQLFNEPTLALELTLALLCLLHFRSSQRRRWLITAGILVGVALMTRWDSLVLVAVPFYCYLLYLVLRERQSAAAGALDLAVYSAPVACGLAVNLFYDFLRYGDPFNPGYSETLGFSTPLLTGLYGLLFSPGAGLLIYVPFLVLSLLGSRRLFRAWPAEAILIASLLVLRLLFYARWWSWDGHDWGPRFLVPVVPLLLLPLAFLPKARVITVAAAALLGLSIGIEVLDQLVPDFLYWRYVVPAIAASLHVQEMYDGCPLCSYRAIQAISKVVDFNWRFAPLVWQLKALARGFVYPSWHAFPYILPIVLLLLGGGLALLARMAASLDRLRRQPEGTATAMVS